MGVGVEVRPCPVVVRKNEGKSVGVSLVLPCLGILWSLLGLPTLCVLCCTCSTYDPLLSMATELNGHCACVSLLVVSSTSRMFRGLGRALQGLRSHHGVLTEHGASLGCETEQGASME